MYATHNPGIRRIATKNPECLRRVVAFVFSSIRERTYLLPKYMEEYNDRREKSSWVWGNKKAGLDYLHKNYTLIFYRMQKILKGKKANADVELMMLFLEIPGLGLAKAGFVVQLVSGKAGCIDSHNIAKFFPDGKAPAWMSVSKDLSSAKKREKVEKYLEFCRTVGGSKYLWDQWCEFIATRYPKHFKDGEHVSQLHLDCVA